MALCVEAMVDEKIRVGEGHVVSLDEIESPESATLRVSPVGGEDALYRIDGEHTEEILPKVFVGVGTRSNLKSLKLLFEAPREVKIGKIEQAA
jgi:hypothetical protein